MVYEKKKLPGAVFRVTAGADIYRADGTKVYSNGDVIAENLVAGSDGQVVLTDLHLGTYVVTETKSIDGYTINTCQNKYRTQLLSASRHWTHRS